MVVCTEFIWKRIILVRLFLCQRSWLHYQRYEVVFLNQQTSVANEFRMPDEKSPPAHRV